MNSPLRHSRVLDSGWILHALGGPIPDRIVGRDIAATVPGSVHTDLMAAGLIPDPYLDGNEKLIGWIGLSDWRYRTDFEWDPGEGEHAELLFHGLDTIATITLNGAELARTENMHRSYVFEVTEQLTTGRNELIIDFASPIRAADAASLTLGYRPHVNHHPYNAIRKMACSFGWDWGIDTATSGIWRRVELRSWTSGRLGTVRPVATVQDGIGIVDVHIEVNHGDVDQVNQVGGAPTRLEVSLAGHTQTVELGHTEDSAHVQLRVPDVQLWWPRGYGDQPLYDLEVKLLAAQQLLDISQRRIGFRTVALDTQPDDGGAPFTINVNDVPIFIHGANWIPDDAFPHRVDHRRYLERIQQAEFANLNLLRIWGGGIYESEEFFDLCDERGMLTWQDFLFACAAYAEEEPLRSQIEAEARQAVTRLAAHPSLIIFNGNNENIWGYQDWHWKLRLEGRTWGAGYYLDLFPNIVAELAPHISYTPGSPFSDLTTVGDELHPNDESHGSMHIWDLWNRRDYPEYRSYRPRFVAEFGWQGPPTWSTLTESLHDDPLTPESPGMLIHQKALEGNDKLTDGLLRHFPLPATMADWHWAMSLNQANAVTTAVEHFRSLAPHCMGSIVWQLNDCWPVVSWAAVDGYGRAKPLLYALRHAHSPRLVTIQPRSSGLVAVAVNDTDQPWRGEICLRRMSLRGGTISQLTLPIVVDARGATTVMVPAELARAVDPADELLVADLDDVRGWWYFTEPRDSTMPPARWSTQLTPTTTGYELSVLASSVVRDLSLLIDRLDPAATVDEMLVSLLPGETVTLQITTGKPMTAQEVCSSEVLRSANQLLPRWPEV